MGNLSIDDKNIKIANIQDSFDDAKSFDENFFSTKNLSNEVVSKNNTISTVQAEQEENLKNEFIRINNKGRQDYYQLRIGWSFFIGTIVFLSVLFQFTATFLIGFNIVKFENHQFLINLVMGENFLQILGLAYIIVKFLFPKDE